MKCLTICQPFAYLIVTPQDELPRFAVQKRVENRTWKTDYRGPLLIHAGKSKKFLSGNETTYPEMPFGAIVGVCDLVGCVEVQQNILDKTIVPESARDKYPWLARHEHAEGPFCFILENIRRLKNPIPYSGSLGLFDVHESFFAKESVNG